MKYRIVAISQGRQGNGTGRVTLVHNMLLAIRNLFLSWVIGTRVFIILESFITNIYFI